MNINKCFTSFLSAFAENNMTESRAPGTHLTLLNNLFAWDMPVAALLQTDYTKEDLLLAFQWKSQTLIPATQRIR